MNNTTVTEDLLRTASRFWLMKSEPGECSIDDALAAPGRRVSWFGIRNYQARNFMRDDMTIGDAVLFYHSSCAKPGIAGIARIASDVYPDELQFDPESEYYDPKSTKENPRWLTLDVEALQVPRRRNRTSSGRARAGGHASASEGQSPLDHARREGGICLHRQKPSLA